MYERIIRGRIVTPTAIIEGGWLGIADGKILAIGEDACPASDSMDDYGDAYILPGVIDGQTHAGSQIGFPGLGPTTVAAAMGGVTTIVDMPYDEPDPITDRPLLDQKIAAIHTHAICDVALYGTVGKSPVAEDVASLIAGGVCAFKISAFEADAHRFPRIDNGAALDLMHMLSPAGLPLCIHNEDQEIVARSVAQLKSQGKTGAEFHSPSRPVSAELTAIATFLETGRHAGCRLHIVHISTAEGFELVRRYREEGVAATAEMCVHYLQLDAAEDTPRLGGLLKVNPPIRAGQREALWSVVENGQAAFVSSDHSAWPLERKLKPSIYDVAAGIPGLETLLPVFFTGAAARRSLDDAACLTAHLLSEAPAQFFGLSHKGKLAPAMDADIAVLEPRSWTYDAKRNTAGPGWSVFDGQTLTGMVRASYVRGRKVWDGERVGVQPGWGRFIARDSRSA